MAVEEIFSLFNRVALRMKDHQVRCLERFDLTPVQANALWRLDPERSLSLSALAQRLPADPSNLSGSLDVLEARGLVVRTPGAHDRRVRAVGLTKAGRVLRERLLACLFDEPPVVAGLSAAERRALRDLLAKLQLEL